jgi:DNA repair protein RadC
MEIKNSTHIAQIVRPRINFLQEQVGCLILDSQLYLLKHKTLFLGTADQVLFHPRDLFRSVFESNGTRFILYHNHTSFNPLPSKEDLNLTSRLLKISQLLEVEFIDHVIFAKESQVSMLELGLMKKR